MKESTLYNLALAIVQQTLTDLIKAYEHGGEFVDTSTNDTRVTAKECEDFLREQGITEIDGDALVEMCKRKAGII